MWRGVLFFIVNRVMGPEQLKVYEDLFVALEMASSRTKDGHLREKDFISFSDNALIKKLALKGLR